MKKTILHFIGIVVCLYVVFGLVVSRILLNEMTDLRVSYTNVFKAEDFNLPTPDTLYLTSSDKIDLVALKVSPDTPKAVIVCLTDYDEPSVTHFWGHAKMFYDAGYASILLETRGHEPSGGEKMGAGYKEPLDLMAVTDFIRNNATLRRLPVVVMGLSYGGTIAINSLPVNNNIDGIISIASASSIEDFFNDIMGHAFPKFLVSSVEPLLMLNCYIKFGVNPWKVSPKKCIASLNGRPALLLHCQRDRKVSYDNFIRLTEMAPAYVQTFVMDGDEHCVAKRFEKPNPNGIYGKVIMNFIAMNLSVMQDHCNFNAVTK